MSDAVKALQLERKDLVSRVAVLDKAIAVLGGKPARSGKKRRKMSAAARKKISVAQKKRWKSALLNKQTKKTKKVATEPAS